MYIVYYFILPHKMELNKLSKTELLMKCTELGITKCKSKKKERIGRPYM